MNAWQRWFWLWNVLFAIDYAGTVWLVLAGDGSWSTRLAAVGALTTIAVGYLLFFGRALDGRGSIGFGATVIVLIAVAVLFDPVAAFGLFGVCPMVSMVLPRPAAIVAIVVLTLLPVVSVLVRTGLGDPSLTILLPMTAMLVVFGVCVGAWIDRVVRESQERADLITQLQASRAEVSRLSHEAGTAAERERLAREIHDTLAQGFTSILSLLQAAESEWDSPEQMRHHLALAQRTARDNLAEARTMVAALTPAALAAGSLEDAVQRQADRLAEEWPVEVSCEVHGPLPPLGTATEVVLLRTVQEAFANAHRHSGAQSVRLSLSVVDACVRLVISDDGAGFDPAAPSAGFGLRGMRARAEQIGGRLTVRSVRNGQGATVLLEVPA